MAGFPLPFYDNAGFLSFGGSSGIGSYENLVIDLVSWASLSYLLIRLFGRKRFNN